MLWKIYTTIWLGLGALGATHVALKPDNPLIIWIGLALDVPSAIALYGYAFNKRFLHPRVWQAYFAVQICWIAYASVVVLRPMLESAPWKVHLLGGLVVAVGMAPPLMALYRYSVLGVTQAGAARLRSQLANGLGKLGLIPGR